MDLQNLANRAVQVREETQQGQNTAKRVGSLFYDIITFFSGLLQGKQDKTDETLQTTDKSVPGAINEVYNGISLLQGNVSDALGELEGEVMRAITIETQNRTEALLAETNNRTAAIAALDNQKQDKSDANLQTGAKTVVAAINEVLANANAIGHRVLTCNQGMAWNGIPNDGGNSAYNNYYNVADGTIDVYKDWPGFKLNGATVNMQTDVRVGDIAMDGAGTNFSSMVGVFIQGSPQPRVKLLPNAMNRYYRLIRNATNPYVKIGKMQTSFVGRPSVTSSVVISMPVGDAAASNSNPITHSAIFTWNGNKIYQSNPIEGYTFRCDSGGCLYVTIPRNTYIYATTWHESYFNLDKTVVTAAEWETLSPVVLPLFAGEAYDLNTEAKDIIGAINEIYSIAGQSSGGVAIIESFPLALCEGAQNINPGFVGFLTVPTVDTLISKAQTCVQTNHTAGNFKVAIYNENKQLVGSTQWGYLARSKACFVEADFTAPLTLTAGEYYYVVLHIDHYNSRYLAAKQLKCNVAGSANVLQTIIAGSAQTEQNDLSGFITQSFPCTVQQIDVPYVKIF
ncbi:MAG: hypothetical protein LBU90_10515 [Bacteroidales bacterium]|jgi:hypothetical protein|nr:hypothetical protein [Bacteroidales bacterium]